MEQITGTGVRVAMATRRGVREFNMDAAAVFESASGLVAAAVVDGIGNNVDGAATMRLVAETAVRIGPARGALAGLLAAAALVEDPGVGVAPDGVAVLALAEPDGPTLLAWVGDSHAYS
ncbi:hypothetical protein [Umezawaea sp. Da 62-37]|uniref:hypothetical protein n=1 Tax=Umezawaea sp. Da 62-37 TaxID=3075927 RepID=UPI0028F723FA|nr:hypothetical protein [Umezawaea sp. Da 62-37]WNV86650.1 hypothetical protein RM788_52485 [Umezawaea sp. Da 62-37]WNV86767.1 hypothetical protein RM788_00320 [Umezawaea sp. Da 62-37]